MAAARREAEDSARDFAVNDLRSGRQIDGRHIEITDASGALLESVAVHDIAMKRAH